MTTILDMKRRFESLNTNEIIEKVMQESTEQIADLNAQQMFAGQRADDTETEPPYAPLTVAIKRLKGQPTDRVTLRDTGAFYRGITAKIEGDQVVVRSTDEKAPELQDKYGDIFGLDTQFKGEVIRETIKPAIKKAIESATGLTMKP